LGDLQAAHDRAIKQLQEQLDAAELNASKLEEKVGQKMMEIKFLEDESEEKQSDIDR
jgi:hypothetical protein